MSTWKKRISEERRTTTTTKVIANRLQKPDTSPVKYKKKKLKLKSGSAINFCQKIFCLYLTTHDRTTYKTGKLELMKRFWDMPDESWRRVKVKSCRLKSFIDLFFICFFSSKRAIGNEPTAQSTGKKVPYTVHKSQLTDFDLSGLQWLNDYYF